MLKFQLDKATALALGAGGREPPNSDSISSAFAALRDFRLIRRSHGGHEPRVTIQSDRYGGVYSGGVWNVAIGAGLDGADDSDPAADEFWRDPPAGVASDHSLSRAICKAIVSAAG